jgi:hypothetical protein
LNRKEENKNRLWRCNFSCENQRKKYWKIEPPIFHIFLNLRLRVQGCFFFSIFFFKLVSRPPFVWQLLGDPAELAVGWLLPSMSSLLFGFFFFRLAFSSRSPAIFLLSPWSVVVNSSDLQRREKESLNGDAQKSDTNPVALSACYTVALTCRLSWREDRLCRLSPISLSLSLS